MRIYVIQYTENGEHVQQQMRAKLQANVEYMFKRLHPRAVIKAVKELHSRWTR
jgi:hypothetical protein